MAPLNPRDPTATADVLLSTYNGAPYLEEQLASIWSQDYPVRLTVRDDGSTDGTVERLHQLLEGRPARLDVGPNVGPAASYMQLLAGLDGDEALVALSDQDDVWLPGKLGAAARALADVDSGTPALYCSQVVVADQDLRPVRLHRAPRRGLSFANALVENVVTGCTIVLNRAGAELAAKAVPQQPLMHDAWLYLLISGCGVVIYDPVPRVLYRQHAGNAVGVSHGVDDWCRRGRRHARTGPQRVHTTQAGELRRLYHEQLSSQARQELDAFLDARGSAIGRLGYAGRGGAHRQRRVDDLVYRVLFALGRV